MAKTTLTISSKNYSSWSLRGWLLAKFSGLEFEEVVTAPDDASARAEILLLSSSILVPCLRHEGAVVWDTLAIAEYLNEVMPDAGLLPKDRVQRAHCRSICGEIHSGFTTLRASLPVNLKGHFPGFKIWSRAQADIDRVCTIWRECLAESGGPFLFGERSMADAMYAPVVSRFQTYAVEVGAVARDYMAAVMALPAWSEWRTAGVKEPWVLPEDEEPEEGGETNFSRLGISFPPQAGTLLMWNNARPDGTVNPEVLHAGMPVVRGVKYVITKWFRVRRWS